MKQHGTTISNLPRQLGSWLVAVSLFTHTLPVAAQAPGANPPPSGTPNPTATTAESPAAPDGAVPTSAPAKDPEAAAGALAEGQEAYRAGNYAEAANHFERSNQLAPSAAAVYWWAMALDLEGRAYEAVRAFDQLFADPSHTELGEELLEPARQRHELLGKVPATVVLNVSPEDATVEIDGALQPGVAPYTLRLAKGKHQLRVSREGYIPLDGELDLEAAQSLEQNVQLEAVPVAPVVAPPAADEKPRAAVEPRSKVPAYVTLGVAGASAVLGTVFGIQALSAKSDFEASPTATNADAVERNALIADMAWGIALTLGVTGVVLLTSEEPASESASDRPRKQVAQSTLQVAPFVSPTSGGAAARLTF